MRIEVWGRGGEMVLGTLTKEQYTYWALKDSEALENEIMDQWDFVDEEDQEEIPEEMKLGSWFELDDVAHESGASIDDGGITVTNSKGETIFEKNFSSIMAMDGLEDNFRETDEIYFSETEHKYGFWAYDAQKGVFGAYEVPGEEFDPRLLEVTYVDIEGISLVSSIIYDGKELEELGELSTDGKSFDWGLIKNTEDGEDEDDLEADEDED